MNVDIMGHSEAISRNVVRRQVGGEPGIGIDIRRTFAAPVAAVWSALTEPEQVQRWFLPVSGDLRVGGTFQTQGNAGGEILRCEPPQALDVTWGGPTSLVEIRLTPSANAETTLDFAHIVPLSLAGSGAGALFVGPGWDGAVLALARYLADDTAADPAVAASSPEALAVNRAAIDAWVAAIRASGTATEEELAPLIEVAIAQWTPNPEATQAS